MDTNKGTRVFNSDFLQEMKEYLMAHTENDSCVTRTQLCIDMELGKELDTVIGAIIKFDHMPGFRIWMGPGGGIGRTGRKSASQSREPGAYAPKLSDDVAATILAKVEELCGGGKVVPRNYIASTLKDLEPKESKMTNLISAALKRPDFADFATKNGKGGGVYKISIRPDLLKRAARVAVKPAAPAAPPVPEAPKEPVELYSKPAEEVDLSAPLDMTLEEDRETLSPLERRWAALKAAKNNNANL